MPVRASEKSPLEPALFEALCRAAATRMEVPSFCRLRRCRRGAFCDGKLEPRAIPRCFHRSRDVHVLLPACMARADDLWFGEFLLEWILCHEDYFDLIRPPEAVRSLLSLDEHWPVFDHDPDEACIPAGGDAIMTRAVKTIVAHADSIAAIRSEREALRSGMKGD